MKEVLQQGRTCKRVERADKVCFLVDGEEYFTALLQTVSRARKSVWIVGWDLDSRIKLRKDRKGPTLRRYLNKLVKRREGLTVRILAWDFAMVYALERQPLPVFHMDWTTHERMIFRLDSDHPFGGSHHQKIVVVDDAVAFCGGLDLTKRRWDTREHKKDDPRRSDPSDVSYGPFHDVQLMVSGPAAAALGDLCRERWRRANDEELPPVSEAPKDPWPSKRAPDVEDVDIGLALTDPAHKGRPEVREVEQLYLDSIAMAKKYIYMENQYFTSKTIAGALAGRLADPDGPEVVMVLPHYSSGWLEQAVMDTLRSQVLRQLVKADAHGRLGVYYPVASDDGERDGDIKVHAKVMVADDSLCRVGSANLSNRSMGLDTECDLCLTAADRDDVREAVLRFRQGLVAEHLGVPVAALAEAETSEGGVKGAIEHLRGKGKTLMELSAEPPEGAASVDPDIVSPLDPERPMDLVDLVQFFDPEGEAEEEANGFVQKLWGVAAILLVLAGVTGLLLAWRYTGLQEYANLETVVDWGERLRNWDLAWAVVIGAYIVGGLVMFPVTVLIAATALVFPSWEALALAILGSQLGAHAGYLAGWLLGRGVLRKLAKGKINTLSRKLARPGIGRMAALRLVPVAPYTVVNMASGAMHVGFIHYALGTLLGMGPGIAAISLFTDQLMEAILNPNWVSAAVMLTVAAALFIGNNLVQRFFGKAPA